MGSILGSPYFGKLPHIMPKVTLSKLVSGRRAAQSLGQPKDCSASWLQNSDLVSCFGYCPAIFHVPGGFQTKC